MADDARHQRRAPSGWPRPHGGEGAMTDDPLDGADVGETREIVVTREEPMINVEPDEFWGNDRDGEVTRVAAELVEDEGEDGRQIVRYTYEGQVTKQLPRDWDKTREPVTDEQARRERRRSWLQRAKQIVGLVVGVAIPVGLGVVITNHMMAATDMTVNGEAVTAPNPVSYTILLGGLILLVFVAAGYGPRMIGHRGSRL